MGSKSINKKRLKGINELLEFLKGDNLKVMKADPESRGKSGKGDLTLQFKGRKYSITVQRKENLSNANLETAREDSDVLMFRKNRKDWKVYMDLNLLILLLLNKRS